MTDSIMPSAAPPPRRQLLAAYAVTGFLVLLALQSWSCGSKATDGGDGQIADTFDAQSAHCLDQLQAQAWASSLAACERAVVLDPGNTNAMHNFAYALRKAGNYTRAEAMFKRVLERDPLSVRSRYELASTYMDAGDRGLACEAFALVLEIEPNHDWAQRRLEQLQCP